MTTALPPQLHVFVRDWLSGNNVVLRSDAGNVLVDSGYSRHVPLTLALTASRVGLEGATLDLVVNTHCHSDHMGGNAALKRAYGCRIAVPEHEAHLVDAWDTQALLLDYAGQVAERFSVDERLVAGTVQRWGDLDWELLAAPGHAMGALVFYNRAHRILISGDALWRDGFGFVMPRELEPEALPATRATLDLLRGLDVAIVIPGHGEPFCDYGAALERAYARLAALEAADPQRTAWHAMRVILAFALLDHQRMALADLPGYVARVPFYRDFNARWFGLAPAVLAERLASDLMARGAARQEDGLLVATP